LSIIFDNVHLRRGEGKLFDGFSATLNEARIGLVGDNGAGKSSLLRLICGLLLPDFGLVSVHGLDTRSDRRRFPGVVGMMFQNPDDQIIFPTVVEELAFSLTALGEERRESRRLARAFLEAHDLRAWGDRVVGSLSQGQRQRLCLLALDIMEPRVLLLDEPVASLDLLSQAVLMRQMHASDLQIPSAAKPLFHDKGVITVRSQPFDQNRRAQPSDRRYRDKTEIPVSRYTAHVGQEPDQRDGARRADGMTAT
jgi:biotin transport system ATP-binding protein